MTEYVVWRVLDHQRQGLAYRSQQARRVWNEPPQPAADAVRVGIMGFGTLGRAAAKALLALGFKLNGWSRSPHAMPGVETFHGADRLDPFLRSTDILVSLLPLTSATRGIIDYALLGKLNRDNPLGGAFLINAGRGRLQKDMDIVRALDDGLIKEASLDVFETEPLPRTSPLWAHPKVFVTPHAAATSDPIHLVPSMLARMDAFERGETLQNVVNREAGY
jgi:glyoxylate/hydroxypyruvate reductase A